MRARSRRPALLPDFFPLPPGLPFNRWFTAHAHAIEVQIARIPGGPPGIRGVAEVAAPAERVFSLLTDFRKYERNFAGIFHEARVFESRDGYGPTPPGLVSPVLGREDSGFRLRGEEGSGLDSFRIVRERRRRPGRDPGRAGRRFGAAG